MLLDESLPRQLARELLGHEVETVQRKGWAGTKNGRLLELAEESAFRVLVSGDQNLEYQQDISKYRVGVVLLIAKSNRMKDLLPLVPEALQAIEAVEPGRVAHVGS